MPKHWIVLVLYIFILLLFYFFLYPGLSMLRANWRKLNSGKATSFNVSLPLDQLICHKDNTDTMVDSVALDKQMMVDAPKNLKQKKHKKEEKKKELKLWTQSFWEKAKRIL